MPGAGPASTACELHEGTTWMAGPRPSPWPSPGHASPAMTLGPTETRARLGLLVPSAQQAREEAMKLSTDRVLTTHVGSLPRPQALVDLLVKKDQNQPYDHADFDRKVTQAVNEIVAHQVTVGIDVVSDGE